MKEQYPLISVIVPVYNVEKYLLQCLESLLRQTYPNFEVILIDDGSTDSSPTICDQYAQRDTRFTVIHQSNSGAVIARKIGIQQAKGTLLSFVDSDDWVEDDFLTHLYQIRTQFKADVSVCAPFGQFSRYQNCGQLVCGQEKALQIIFTDKFFAGYLWNKLYPISYWQDITWPPQSMFEDLFLNAQLFNKAKIITFSSKKLYHYRLRSSSISHKNFGQEKLFYFDILARVQNNAKQNGMNSLFNSLCVCGVLAAVRNIIHYFRSKQKNSVLLAAIIKNLKTTVSRFCAPHGFLTKCFILLKETFWMLLGDFWHIIYIRKYK